MAMRVVIVGAGATGSELAERLAHRHEVILVDVAGHALERFGELAKPEPEDEEEEEEEAPGCGVRVVRADGTSRLQLGKLFDPDRACALVAAGGSDEVNLEAVRFARELGYDPILALQHDHGLSERYRETRATLLHRPKILADYVERSLEHKGAVVPVGIGLGRGELVEIRLLGTSPILDRPLRDLAPDRWRIAAIFRGDELIVPTGDVRLKTDDRVLLVGDPVILATMAEHLRLGTPQFPQPFGPHVVSLELEGHDDVLLREARGLAEACPPAKLVRGVLDEDALETAEPDDTAQPEEDEARERISTSFIGLPNSKEMASCAASQGAGVVVVRPFQQSLWNVITGRRGPDARLCDHLQGPVLFRRGTFPYRRILLPISASPLATEAAGVAIDLTRRLCASLTAVNVDLPRYISGESEDEAHFEVVPIRRLCQLYEVPLEYRHHVGNPVRFILQESKHHDLVVLARHHRRRDSYFDPDVALWIARRATCSVLVLTVIRRT